ncbi:aminotransferase class I/II-fold pyridoxal phosphate-dependent enzyme [Streptomyces sp. NPDC005953]|uniref:aminotransferase class I/II-fold pyridoxal phosphate-dependent enzyme n=1 Tax=unclassified Streptomyces TaxID=2593676 RepID=UPI0033EF2EDD
MTATAHGTNDGAPDRDVRPRPGNPPGLTRLTTGVRDPSARGIASHVAELIRSGELTPGDRLPQVRALAGVLRVSPATVSSAWALLKKRGLIVGTGKSGTRVTGPVGLVTHIEPASIVPARSDLRLLYPDLGLLPLLAPALASAADLPGLDEYYDSPILPALRAVVEPGWPYRAEAYAVANGASDAVWTVLQSLSVPGDRIVVESPGQPQMLHLMNDLGLTVIEVPYLDDGLSAARLADALKTRPVAVFFQPRAQIPTGFATVERRARRIAALVGRQPSTVVVEYDDLNSLSSRELYSVGQHLPEQTIHIKSYEKSYGPDLRLAVVGAPAARMSLIHAQIRLTRQWTSRILQNALAWLLEDERTSDGIARARDVYAERLSVLTGLLRDRGVEVTGSDGFCTWIPVRSEARAVEYLAAHGVLVLAGATSYPSRGPAHIRVATSRMEPALSHRLADLLAESTTVPD